MSCVCKIRDKKEINKMRDTNIQNNKLKKIEVFKTKSIERQEKMLIKFN